MMSFHSLLYEWSRWVWPCVGNHLWQSTIFSVVALGCVMLLRRAPARVRYAIWLTASVKLALPSIAFLFLASQAGLDVSAIRGARESGSQPVSLISQIAEPVLPASDRVPARIIPDQEAARIEMPVSHGEVYCALTLVWAAGCASLLGVLGRRRLAYGRALRKARSCSSGRETEALARALAIAGQVQLPRLVISEKVTEPGVLGAWRPILALPENLSDQLSDPELDFVLLHELVHIKRRDNLVSNLQMLLCCLFWFYPLVWLIDNKLLTERERATDEQVVALGAPPKVYAASLLKVLRFCLGWRVAGVSTATGSNMQRRVEMIISNTKRRKASRATMRLLAVALMGAVALFSVATGLVDRNDAMAQGAAASAANGATPGSEPAPVLFGAAPELTAAQEASSPIAQGSRILPDGLLKDLSRQAEQAPDVSARFENSDTAPLHITDAKVKIVAFQPSMIAGSAPNAAYEVITQPSITLRNETNQRITFVRVNFSLQGITNDVTGRSLAIEPHAAYVLHFAAREWSSIAPAGSYKRLIVKVMSVRFEDGEEWGVLRLPTDGPAVAATPQMMSAEPAVAPSAAAAIPPEVGQPGAPPVAATTPPPAFAPQGQPWPASGPVRAATPGAGSLPFPPGNPPVPAASAAMSPPPDAPRARASTWAIAALDPDATPRAAPRSPIAAPHAIVEYVPAKYINPEGAPLIIGAAKTGVIERAVGPRGQDMVNVPVVTLTNATSRRITAIKLRFKWNTPEHAVTTGVVTIDPRASIVFRSNMTVLADPGDMKVQVIGVKFEDGGEWGSMTSTVDSRLEWLPIK